MAPQDFVTAYSPVAQMISDRTGVDASNVLGLMALETGWGKNTSGNNMFGLSDPQGQKKLTYATTDDAASHFTNLLNNSVYRLVGQASPEQQLHLLADLGWNTANPRYGDTATQIATKIRQMQSPQFSEQ